MNLLVNNLFRQRTLKPGLIILISVFFGCETQSDLGIGYRLDSNANVKLAEFELTHSNIFIDSLRTDVGNNILTGSYSDPITGNVTAEGYFQFFYNEGPLPNNSANPTDTLKLDSIVMLFEANSTIPEIGNSFQEFSLFTLQDTLDSRAIYLSGFKQETEQEIGSFSKIINPENDSYYRIRLTSEYAQRIFGSISEVSSDENQSIFSATFKSLALIPNENSESIVSLNLASDTSRMTIYSSPTRANAKDTTYTTLFEFNSKKYSYLNRDRSGSSFDGIEENQNYDLPNKKTIIEPLTGLSTSFSIEPIIDFFSNNPRILINNATIEYEFEAEDDRDTLTNFMNFFRKPDNSFFGPAIFSNPFSNIVMVDNSYLSLSPDPLNGSLNNNKDLILASPTLFFQQLYKPFSENQELDSLAFINPTNGEVRSINDLVLISPVDITLQRSVFKSNGIRLKLYYTEIDQ